MARKLEVFHPPHLYCQTTLPIAKQTLVLISVLKCLGPTLQSQRHGVVGVSRMGKPRVVFIDPGAKVNSL